MKTVELNELQKQVLLTHTEALTVTHNGKIIGHFYPIPQNKAKIDQLWERFEKVNQRVMEKTGLDEEALINALDFNKLFRFD